MRHLCPPPDDPGELFKLCAEGTNDPSRSSLALLLPTIKQAASDYEKAAQNSLLHQIHPNGCPGHGDHPQGPQLRKLYTNHLSRKGSRARSVYSKLLMRASNGICPLCCQQAVKTLDHHLPKDRFPELSVNPLNLVPSCSDCNHRKGNAFPRQKYQQTYHPYFDRFPDAAWLFAEIEWTPAPALKFSPVKPSTWTQTQFERMRFHFDLLRLREMYAVYGAQEMTAISGRLEILFKAGGTDLVRSHLKEELVSRECMSLGSWQAATYQALARDPHFCSGGFRGVAA